MGIAHRRQGAVAEGGAGKGCGTEHGALDMDMGINQARQNIARSGMGFGMDGRNPAFRIHLDAAAKEALIDDINHSAADVLDALHGRPHGEEGMGSKR